MALRTRIRQKRICFTLNNYTSEDESRIQHNIENYQYAVYGRETAPTTGTKHLQGFINFKSKREFNAIRDIIGSGCHIEGAKGTDVQNQIYCTKSGDFWEYGIPVGQGKRSDLDSVAEDIKGGMGLFDVVNEHTSTFIRYPRGIKDAIEILRSGAPGSGRSFKTQVSYAQHFFIIYYMLHT